jgi:uncharacterized membrane protein AbrB (regulator of aidB expression)
MARLQSTIVWLSISIILGALFSYFTEMNFWLSIMLTAISLLIIGWLADIEDRGKFND